MNFFHRRQSYPWLGTCWLGDQQILFIAMTPILDSRKLLAFATLARVGSFTLAARELHLTQSAVSHAIKSLEQELACRLFDRHGRSVSLTHAGLQLLDHAHKILAEMRDARAELTSLGKIAANH